MVMKNGRLEATREEEAKEDEIEPKHHTDKEMRMMKIQIEY